MRVLVDDHRMLVDHDDCGQPADVGCRTGGRYLLQYTWVSSGPPPLLNTDCWQAVLAFLSRPWWLVHAPYHFDRTGHGTTMRGVVRAFAPLNPERKWRPSSVSGCLAGATPLHVVIGEQGSHRIRRFFSGSRVPNVRYHHDGFVVLHTDTDRVVETMEQVHWRDYQQACYGRMSVFTRVSLPPM